MNWLKRINDNNIELSKINIFIYYFFIFVISSIIGWVYEEIFYYIADGYLYNRGFFYGPYLPVYGIGAVFFVFMLKKIKKYPILVFLAMMIISGIVEYFIGKLMISLYDQRWWEYDNSFLNIEGIVCLRSVLSFAIMGLPLIYLIAPLLKKVVSKCQKRMLILFSSIIVLIMLTDVIITLLLRYPLW